MRHMGKSDAWLPWIVVGLLAATFLWLEGCKSASPTGSSPLGSVVSPRGWFTVRKIDVEPQEAHGVLAEHYWEQVTACTGDFFTPHHFYIDLRSGPWVDTFGRYVGGVYHARTGIEVSEPDPQAWRHEMIHYWLDVKKGSPNDAHDAPEWRCQY